MAGSDDAAARPQANVWHLLVGGALVALAGWALARTLAVGTTDPSVVELQFAGNARTATELLGDADAATIDDLRTGLARDCVLVITYVAAIGYWCRHGARHLRTKRSRSFALGMAYAVGVAGVADLVENLALAFVIDARGDSDWAVVATAAAIPKWIILAAAIPTAVVVLAGTVARLLRPWLRSRLGRAPAFPADGERPGPPATYEVEGAPVDHFSRNALKTTPKVTGPEGPLGACFSGGGIRSATFNMGVLQVLAEEPAPHTLAAPDVRDASFLRSAAYLTCVSGGSYIAGALQMLARDAEGEQVEPAPTFAPGSSEESFLRLHGRYLADTAAQWAGALARVLAGVALNVLVFTLILFTIGRPLGWVQHDLFHVMGSTDDLKTTGAMWAAVGWTAGVAVVLYLAGTVAGGADGEMRRTLEGIAFGFLALGFAVLAVVWLLPLLSRVVPGIVETIEDMLTPGDDPAGSPTGATVLIVTGGGSLAATTLAIINRPAPPPERDVKPRWPALSRLWGWITAALPYIAGLLLAVLALLLLALFTGQAARRGVRGEDTIFGIDGRIEVWAFLVAAGLLAAIYAVGDQTRWSLAPFYKRRLASAFALRYQGNRRTAREREWREPTTLSLLAKAHDDLPELLVCAAANLSSPEAAPPGRRAQSFVFSSTWVGGPAVGWAWTRDFEAALKGPSRSDGTLLGAMAISGAAFASAMGRHSKGTINALLAASNARLGVWLPSPQYIHELRGALDEPQYRPAGPPATAPVPMTPPAGRPAYAGPWSGRRRLPYLFKELVGIYSRDDRFVYLTDGGHYENLGLVELLRRRCRMILCFDASGDDLVSCGTFVEALTLAREELGVEVTIDLSPLAPKATRARRPGVLTKLDTRLSNRSVVRGDICYPDGTGGKLILAKASLTETTPATVLAHAARQAKATFPNDSTGDQFFDHTQFDAYSTLGNHIAREAVATARRACHAPR
jgi:hypothetical protein